MKTITINGVDLELDLLDADEMERFEQLNQECMDKFQQPNQYEGLTTSAAMKLQCKYIREFFDKFFGDGTAARIFGDSNHLGKHFEAYTEIAAATRSLRSEMDEIGKKYNIDRLSDRAANRSQRRYNNKKRRK
jgi:hypothetical protein